MLTGGQIISAPSRFLWKGEIIDMPEYTMINSYTIEENRQAIIESVRKTSIEEVPMITFTQFMANEELAAWIDNTLS